jgi:hypothetical protein
MDPDRVADALRLGLITASELAGFIDDTKPPPGARLIWRTSYTRANRAEPTAEVFATLAAARAHANKVARFRDSGPGGKVTRVEIEEALMLPWAVIEERDLDGDGPTHTPELGGELQATEDPMNEALERMLIEDRERGVDVFSNEAKPIDAKPMRPVVLPPPDWRGEDGLAVEGGEDTGPGDVEVTYDGDPTREIEL